MNGFIVGCLLGFIVGILLASSIYRWEAIKYHAAHYDPQTAAFTWETK